MKCMRCGGVLSLKQVHYKWVSMDGRSAASPLCGECYGWLSDFGNEDHGSSEEVRVVDPDTGGEKGSKFERFDLIPVGPLTELARHYGLGAEKYETRNWERGYAFSLSYASMMRHATQWWNGEDVDEETGTSHLAAVAWHAFALLEFMRTHPEKDDRPK